MRTDDRPHPCCTGCDEYLTMDEIRDGHVCRISSGSLPVMVIALAQAGCLGDAWEVDSDGKGFVVFYNPQRARKMLHAIATQPTEGNQDV